MEKPLFEPQNLSRVSPLLAFFVFALLALRFIVVVVIAKKFGMSQIADVLFIAQLIPISLFLQNRKALMLAFVPVYTDYIVHSEDEEVWRFTNQFANLVLIAAVVVTVLYVLSAPLLMKLLTAGFSEEQRMLTTRFTQLLAPAMFFFILFSLEEGILYSFRHYTTTSWSFLLGVLGGLFGLILLTDRYGLFGYGYGSLVGFGLQCLIPLALFWKYRHRFKLSLNFRDPGLRRIYSLLGPIYLFAVFVALIHVTNRALATTLGPGRVSAFQYCLTLTGILPLLLTQSVLGPLFPIISEKVVRKEMAAVKELLLKGTQVLFFIVAPIVVALWCLRIPVIRLLFERGEFTAQDTELTAQTLIFFAPFILGMTLNMYYSQFVVNLGLIRPAARLVFSLLIVNVLFCLLFMRVFDVGGIALALTTVYFIMAYIFMLYVKGRIGTIGFGGLAKPSLKVIAACLLSALPVLWLSPHIEAALDMSRLSFRVAGLLLEGGLFFVVYALLVWMLRMEEATILSQFLEARKENKASLAAAPLPSADSGEPGGRPSGIPI